MGSQIDPDEDRTQYINPAIRNSRISTTVQTFMLALELKNRGHDIVDLSVGEPHFKTPDVICEAGISAIRNGKTKYTAVTGTPELKTTIASYMSAKHGFNIEPSQITVTSGAVQSIYAALMTTCQHGDYVLVPSPVWPSYFGMPKANSINVIEIKTKRENNYLLTPEELQHTLDAHRDILPKIKLLIFCQPSNPTGFLYSRNQLLEISSILVNHPQIFVISDEIYADINFGIVEHTPFITLPKMAARTFLVSGFSKSFAMTGWRIGFVIASKFLTTFLNKPVSFTTNCPSSVSQAAATEAFANPSAGREMQRMVSIYKARCDAIYKVLLAIPGFQLAHPHGSFYFFIDISLLLGKHSPAYVDQDGVHVPKAPLEHSHQFTNYVLYTKRVAVVPGNDFGSPECFRICYAKDLDYVLSGVALIHEAVLALTEN